MQESGENYLETILMLEERAGTVRSVDIATELGYSKPSVSRAMAILRRDGLIIMEQSGQIRLTDAGRKQAGSIYERHLVLTRFLVLTLGLDELAAARDACRIEHVISPETFDRVKDYVENDLPHSNAAAKEVTP